MLIKTCWPVQWSSRHYCYHQLESYQPLHKSQTEHQLQPTLPVIVFSHYSQHMVAYLGHFWFVVLFEECLFHWRERSHMDHFAFCHRGCSVFTESQSAEAGRVPQRSFVPIPLLKQGHLEPVTQELVQVYFDCL